MSLFSELQRRNVFRIAAAYVVLSWLLLQVGDILFETLELPAAWNKGLLALIALGFLPALVFSWVYEFTPDGVKRESEIAPGESITAHTGRRLDLTVIVLLVLASGLYVYGRFIAPESAPGAVQPVATAASTDPAPSDRVPADPAPPEPGADRARGVAVLPFENLSDDPSNAFFAGGVHEDVLTQLSRVPDLRIISRTSMIKIAETDLSVSEMAGRLGVSHVLEGTVRRAGDRVRVTVQLIDGASDEHVWAENYDRTLTDVFAIQSEIALAIAEQLEAALSPKTVQSILDVPTQNAEAYDLYLKARQIEGSDLEMEERYRQVIDLMERVTALDPDFVEAQAMLAHAHGRLVWMSSVDDPDGVHEQTARTLTEMIQRRWPLRPESRIALGNYLYTVQKDYARAQTVFAELLLEWPNHPEALAMLANSLKRLGRHDEQAIYTKRVLELDPESYSAQAEHMLALSAQGREQELREHLEQMRRRFPDSERVEGDWAYGQLLMDGNREPLMNLARRLDEGSDEVHWAGDRIWWLIGEGRLEEAEQLSSRDRAYQEAAGDRLNVAVREIDLAAILRLQGRDAEARESADRALQIVTELSQGRRFQRRRDWALYASVAAQAGDRDAYQAFRQGALDREPEDVFGAVGSAVSLAVADALMVDPAEAWASLEPWRKPGYLTPGRVAAYREYYSYFFGEVPEFQEYLATFQAVQ